ncbi:MAG: type VI secretion system tip protein VgrG [Polyangiaceae bacterium]|nr:type VI secretion system tip protein VgrG [Polyangiaceae bacterium]
MANVDLWYEGRTDDATDRLSVRQFSISEGMSTPFRVGLLCAKRGHVDLSTIVGRPARFRILPGDNSDTAYSPRSWGGICGYMEQLQAEPTGEYTYFMEIVPEMWRLQHRVGCRIFQQQTIPSIVRDVLAEAHVAVSWSIDTASYRVLDYRVQYNESDFSFVQRLLAEAGLSYYFDTGLPDSPLSITDAPHAAESMASLPYADNPSRAPGPYVTHVHVTQAMGTSSFHTRDYDFLNPSYRLTGAAPQNRQPEFDLTQYRYAPGYSLVEMPSRPSNTIVADDRGIFRSDVEFANHRDSIHEESARVHRRTVRYQTNYVPLAAGSVFSISDHPHPDLGGDHRLLVIETVMDGSPTTSEWSIGGKAVFASLPYRPKPVAKPLVHGPQTASVVGPGSDEVHVDEHGRVRVKMHWDRQGSPTGYDRYTTAWMRVSQGWAGAGYGMVMLPRVGHEVLVAFLDGDPDQPMVVGRLYNQTQPLPYPLPRNKNISTWQSRSTPGSNGFNEIKFDDNAGREQVYIQAERDLRKLVKHNESITVGVNRSASIGAVNSIHAGQKHEVVIGQPHDPPPTIPPTRFTMVDKKITLTTGEATIELDGPDIKITAKGSILMAASNGIAMAAPGGTAVPAPPAPPAPRGSIEVTASGFIDVTAMRSVAITSLTNIVLGANENFTASAGGTLNNTSDGDMTHATQANMKVKSIREMLVASSGGMTKIQGGPVVEINTPTAFFADRVMEKVSPAPGPDGMLPIVTGAATVFIGGPAFPFTVRRLPDGTIQVGDHILIKPSAGRYPDFQAQTLRDLGIISTTPSGLQRLNNIQNNPRGHNVVIREYSAAETANPALGPNNAAVYVDNFAASRVQTAPGGAMVPGAGSGSNMGWDPTITTGPRGGPAQPSDSTLFHELGHAEHNAWGVNRQHQPLTGGWTNREEWQNIEGGVNQPGGTQVPGGPVSPTENQYLGERGYPLRRTGHRAGMYGPR